MKKFWVCMAGIMVGTIMGSVLYGSDVVDAATLVNAYAQNRITGDDTYKSRRVAVRGLVGDIGQDRNGGYVVTFSMVGGGRGIRLMFYFPVSEKESIKQLTNGQQAVIEGFCQGANSRGGIVIFERSALLSSGRAEEMSGKKTATGRDADLWSALVTIEGNKGSGTGFVAFWEGRKVVVTNMHVLFNCGELRLTDCDNTELDPGKVWFSSDRDLVFIEVENYSRPGLTLAPHYGSEMMNRTVQIYGNSQGAGVNTSLSGSVVGIGPKKLEITAPIVEGNSGSPILADRKVIGVATSALLPMTSAITEGSRFYAIRRFGVRVDGLKPDHFQEYVPELYRKDYKPYHMIQHYDEMLCQFLLNPWNANTKIELSDYEKYPELLAVAKEWNALTTSNDRYRHSGHDAELASDSKFNYLVTKRLHQLFVSPVQKWRDYEFHYRFMGESSEENLDLYGRMLKVFSRYEKEFVEKMSSNDAESSRSRSTSIKSAFHRSSSHGLGSF